MSDIETEPRHGERGWNLLVFWRDEETGENVYRYQRKTGTQYLDQGRLRDKNEDREVRRRFA